MGDVPSSTAYTSALAERAEGPTSTEVVFRSMPANAEQQLTATGAKVATFSERFERATVDITNRRQAEAIADLRFVRFIRMNHAGITNAGSTGERPNEAQRHAELLDAESGTLGDGSGTRVGIVSDSFTQTSGTYDSANTTGTDAGGGTPEDSPREVEGLKNQQSGDLPDVVDIRDDSGSGSIAEGVSDEGAAMAEIVHDVAPGAAISFHQGTEGELAMAEAFADLCTARADGGAGADVVVDDLAYVQQPVFQPGIINQAITEDCIANNVPVVTAAGNGDDAAIRQTYKDVDPVTDDPGYGNGFDERSPDNGADFHQWENGDEYLELTLEDNSAVLVVLQWNQPALSVPNNDTNGPRIDLDMRAYESPSPDSTGQVSWNDQMAADPADGFDPIEQLYIMNGSGSEKTYYLAINHFAGSKNGIPQDANKPLEMSLMFFPDGGNPQDVDREVVEANPAETGSVFGHSNAEGVISVASLWWNETTAFDITLGETTNRDVAPYSSTGGDVSLPFAADGTVQDKMVSGPTITGIDGPNTSFFGGAARTNQDGENDGFLNFYGTSAAAPNIAGHLAVMQGLTKQERSVDDLRYVLTENAVDVTGDKAEIGPDMATGAGLYRSDRGAQALLPVATVETSSTGDINPGDTVDLTAEPTGGSMPYSYDWRQVSGPTQSLSNASDDNQTTATFDQAGTYAFEVDVTESSGRTFTVTTERTVDVVEENTDDGSGDGGGGSGGDTGGGSGGGSGGSSGGGGGGAFGGLPLALLLAGGLSRSAARRAAPGILTVACALGVNACASAGEGGQNNTAHEPAMIDDCLRTAVDAGAGDAFTRAVRDAGGKVGASGARVMMSIDRGGMDRWDDLVADLRNLDGVHVDKASRRWERVAVNIDGPAAVTALRHVAGVRQLSCAFRAAR